MFMAPIAYLIDERGIIAAGVAARGEAIMALATAQSGVRVLGSDGAEKQYKEMIRE